MRMIFTVFLLLSWTFVQVNTSSEKIFCSLSSSDAVMIENLPTIFEFNVPYTVTLSSNNTSMLSYITLDIDYTDASVNKSNSSICSSKNKTMASFRYKIEFVIKFEKNSTKSKCVQLKLHKSTTPREIKIAELCTNSTTDKVVDNDDKYDVQSYMRTINTTDIALLDNFNWLIFGPSVQQTWFTHEGMRLSRECDAAENGRLAIFNAPRGKRQLISRPIDFSNVSLLYIRLGSGTCPSPAPTDSPVQVLITTDCLNYSNWHVIHSQRILPGIEHVTVPISLGNITNSSSVCLKIEQEGEKFNSSGSWFIDDLLITRPRLQNEYFSENFQAMQPANWYRLMGGHLKTCDGRMSMTFESNTDIRTELGATTIDFPLLDKMDNHGDVLFHLTKNISIDWTKWNATGVLDFNQTCTNDDVITFNGENYRQLCSPTIELGRIDSVRFTLSTEPCTKRNKYIPTPSAIIFLSIFYNGSTVGYSRTIRRILLNELKQGYKTFDIRFDELHHGASPFGRICLSQYHQASGKNVDVWSVRDFLALPLLPLNISHYFQLALNTHCSQQTGGIVGQSVNIEYSVDYGKHWNLLLQPCFLGSACSHDVQHVYSSKIVLPSTDWHRITLPLPMATLQQKHIRFRVSTPPSIIPAHSWAIEKVFIGRCFRACSGHGWCHWNSCKCDAGFAGDFCQISNVTLFNRGAFLEDDQTESMTYQGGRLSYQCDIISQGKALVFSKPGFRFLRISNINGSSPKLLEFTLRLGSANPQCYGTSKTDLDRDAKAILLLSSCSNGVHWTIIDRFRISDLLAPDFGTMNRIIFEKNSTSDNCLIEWRQMTHGGDNQDVWAIDDITIREIPSAKSIKQNLHVKTFQTKLVYIRPRFILSFRLESTNRKESITTFDIKDIRLRINATVIDLSNYGEMFSYQSINGTATFILTLPPSIWFKHVIFNLTIVSTKKFDLILVDLGVQCENNCWLNGFCVEGICLKEDFFNQSMSPSLNEEDLFKYRLNLINDELLLPFMDSTEFSAIHFQSMSSVLNKNKLIFQCSSNGGVKWFEIGEWVEKKTISLKDHYVPIPAVCQAKQTLFRWQNTSVRLINVAFVKWQNQQYFIDQCQNIDPSKWLYPTYSANFSGISSKKIRNHSSTKSIFQLTTTAITLQLHDYVLMIDSHSNLNNTRLQIDYTIDNITWHELIDTKDFERSMNRFGLEIPKKLLRRSILLRIHSDQLFVLNHIYVGPPCPANCYGHGKCLWRKQQAVCQCDHNRTSVEKHCLPTTVLSSSLYETFANKLNSLLWKISSHAQITHRCYNRQSKTTPYLCFLPNNQSQRSYVMVGPFKTIKYVLFKFGLQYMNSVNCSNQILFQYSYDNGIQWHTRKVLDETANIFEKFDDLPQNIHLHLRWIEHEANSCLMWNLRSIIIRTQDDDNLWFDNRTHAEHQTWEFPLRHSGSMIQFDLQMLPLKRKNNTVNWNLALEISADAMNGWSNWMPLIPSCNQSNLYCDERIGMMGSLFLAELYEKSRNVTIPIPDHYVNQEVRFRWITDETDAKFVIKKVYIGADCPWFCSGHGLCQSNGCLCDHGYLPPYCASDLSMTIKEEIPAIQLNANLSFWSDQWGYDRCSANDERVVFAKAGTRAIVSPEISLIGIQYLRIQLDTCFNRTQSFLDPIDVQISMNNGIFWQTLMTIFYRSDSSYQPWMIRLSQDETAKRHLVRIRLFQRVTTKWTSTWILHRFEMIPEKLPSRLMDNHFSLTKTCNYKNYIFPLEIHSTIDIELNETSFLTFQLDAKSCVSGSPVTPNRSQYDLEYSIDHGQSWSSIDRPSTLTSNTNDIIITGPLRAIGNIFYLPLYAYRPLSKFIRVRWIAANATIATRWLITNVTIRSECEVLCELDSCNGKCRCPKAHNCTSKTTFFERFNSSSPALSEVIILPPLNLRSTRFFECHLHIICKQSNQLISLEYSRNLGLTWQLFRYYNLYPNDEYLIHEDFIDEMKYDFILIRLVFHSNSSKCIKLEQIIVGGTNNVGEVIYGKFDRSKALDPNLFLTFGDGIFNGTYLIYSTMNKTNATINELITDNLNIFEEFFYIQLSLIPLAFNHCIKVRFAYSSDYGYTWQSLEHDDILFFDDQDYRKTKIFTWKFPSTTIGSNQVRFRLRFNDEPFVVGISQLYIGSNCFNACHGHGMCSAAGQCRCDPGWINNDCSSSSTLFPNEIDILKQDYYISYGTVEHKKCRRVFNNTCKREFQTHLLDIKHIDTYVYIALNDQCIPKENTRKNGDGWIRLQYREMNAYQWITLHIFKGYDVHATILLPSIILQLRLIQDSPIRHRSPWLIEQFYLFHTHSSLQWLASNDSLNNTFLTLTNVSNEEILYQTKDVYFHSHSILQLEYNDTNLHGHLMEYSVDLGLTWMNISDENHLTFAPMKFHQENMTFYRLTINVDVVSNIRFRFRCRANHLRYVYLGNLCSMNCYGNGRCMNGQCQIINSVVPIMDFRETFDKDFQDVHWLQVDEYQQDSNRIVWTTPERQAITKPIDLKSIWAIKWTYNFHSISKTCHSSIYFLISTDGTLTWSIFHQLDFPMKNITTSVEVSVDLESIKTKYSIGQFRWYEPASLKCQNFTWGLSKIITIKSVNVYFLTDYFYAVASSRSNWESIDGALLAHSDQCNNNLPAMIFHQAAFSIVTVPILIQSFYVLVFQTNSKCYRNTDTKSGQCRNVTSVIEYRTESSSKWLKLADMADLACQTSLINGGYFNIHTIKLPVETYSRGTQFRWIGTQAEGERWSMNSLFIGECPEYCHDRGLCTITGCQCVMGYAGTYCEKYVGNESLPTWFNETFDDLFVVGATGPNSNNWIKLKGDGHIRHVCDEDSSNTTNNYLSGQALHFGAGCGCGHVEAITRELNITQATTISFAFHVTMEDNCLASTNNITVALEWTYDEGISWKRLVTLYNQEDAQFSNITLPSNMITIGRKRTIGGVRFRWTQVERTTNDTYWSIDNILLE